MRRPGSPWFAMNVAPRMRREIGTVVALLCSSSAAVGATAPTSEQIKLASGGASGNSPVINSILGREALGEQTVANPQIYAQLAEQVARERDLVAPPAPPNADWATRVAPIQELVDNIEAVRTEYARLGRGVASAQEGNAMMNPLSMLLPGGKGRYGATAVKIGSSSLIGKADEALQKIGDRYAADYSAAIENAVTLALLKTDRDVALKWANQGVDEGSRALALKELFGLQADFFDPELMRELGPDVKADLTGARTQILAAGLARLNDRVNQGEGAVAALAQELRGGLKDNAQKIKDQAREIQGFRAALSVNTQMLQQMTARVESSLGELKTGMDHLNDRVGRVEAGLGAMQLTMWRQMGPQEQLLALQDGFLPHVQGAERETLKADLSKTARIAGYRDAANKALGFASELSKAALAIGLPIDTYNFNRNIQTAQSAVNVFANFASGNIFGALGAAGGLFGGGGVDPTQASLEEIKSQLQEVIRLQVAIINKLDLLSQQIARSTQLLMGKLADIEGKVDLGNGLLVDALREKVLGCASFVRTAQESPNGMRSGAFPSLQKRRAHFDTDVSVRNWTACREFLSGTIKSANASKVTSIDTKVPSTYIVHPLLVAEVQEYKETTGSPYSSQQAFRNMVTLTDTMLSRSLTALSLPIGCRLRILSSAAKGPQRFTDFAPSDFNCKGDADSGPETTGLLRLRDGSVVSPLDAFEHALAPGAIRQIGEFMHFVAPYSTLVSTTLVPAMPFRMKTDAELLNGSGGDNVGKDELHEWPEFFLDVINLVIAQETIYTGAPLLASTAEVLKSSLYGHAAVKLPALEEIKDDGERNAFVAFRDTCTADPKYPRFYADYKYAVTFCLLRTNPHFGRNTLTYLVREHVDTPGKRAAYRWALATGSEEDLRALLPGLPLERESEGKPWGVCLRRFGGTASVDLHCMALPSASELGSSLLSTRVSGSLLHDLREKFLERLSLLQVHAQPLSAGARHALKRASVTDPTFATIDFAIPLREQPKEP